MVSVLAIAVMSHPYARHGMLSFFFKIALMVKESLLAKAIKIMTRSSS